jgi:hypothetical protein
LAINSFKLQYDALPGDFPSATSFWPDAGTSDGNGDGVVNVAADTTLAEDLYTWQHLSLASLVSGNYVGGLAGTLRYEVGSNTPNAGVREAGVCIFGISGAHYGTTGNALQIGRAFTVGNGHCNGRFLTPQESRSIDEKLMMAKLVPAYYMSLEPQI